MKKLKQKAHYLVQKYQQLTQKNIEGINLKIQFGSGNNFIKNWLNTDIPEAFSDYSIYPDAYINITKRLPIKSNSCQYLYNEHLIEHITVKEGQMFLKECHRILKIDGVLRIATPDLNNIVKKYSSKSWKKQDWLTWPEYKFIKTRAEMLNIAMRWWGHKYLYDEVELTRRLKEAGFTKIVKCKLNKSYHNELNNLETRKDSKLILEATK